MSEDIIFELGQIAVGGYYDYQDIRIAQMNRIRDVVRRKIIGLAPNETEKKKEEKSFDKLFIDKNVINFLDELKTQKKLTEEEYSYITKLLKIVNETKKTEANYKKLMEIYITSEPIWYLWLQRIKGISAVLASNLIKNFGYTERFRYVSSMWRYCGLDPQGAKGREKKVKLTYNPKMKTLMWKISDSFVKQRTQPYRTLYDETKHIESVLMEKYGKDVEIKLGDNLKTTCKSKLHVEFRARRKAVKLFLQHYYVVARTIKGLPLTKPYVEEKLGHTHIIEAPYLEEIQKWVEKNKKL